MSFLINRVASRAGYLVLIGNGRISTGADVPDLEKDEIVRSGKGRLTLFSPGAFGVGVSQPFLTQRASRSQRLIGSVLLTGNPARAAIPGVVPRIDAIRIAEELSAGTAGDAGAAA